MFSLNKKIKNTLCATYCTLYVLFILHGFANANTNILNLRVGHHSGFLRIVLGAEDPIISKAVVKQKKDSILVTFSSSAVVQAEKVPIPYKTANDQITFFPGKFSKFKSYLLKNPNRLVIDLYHNTKTEFPSTPSIRTERGHSDMKIQENPPRYASPTPLSKTYSGGSASITKSHLALADNYVKVNDNMSAIKHLTLAYIYADTEEEKAFILFKRGELYQKMGFFYEAKTNYINLLKNHPATIYTPQAHLNLAKTLEVLDYLDDAIEHYKKVSNDSHLYGETLYGMANALQRLGRIQEAYKAYIEATNIDRTYLEGSDETQYLFGDNLRLMGKKEDAKQYLSKIQDSKTSNFFGDGANISLGLISMDEGNIEEAMKYFSSVSSKDKKLKAMALLHLAKALSKSGRSKDAITTLSEIRRIYPYTAQYREATLELSKIHRNEGRLSEAISLLRELLSARHIPDLATDELQAILFETARKDNSQFMKLWKEYKSKLFHPSKEQFLLNIAEMITDKDLKLDLYRWLTKNASETGKTKAATILASLYVDMGKPEEARGYLAMVKKAKGNKDDIFRIEAKIDYLNEDYLSAMEKLLLIHGIKKDDIILLGDLISKAEIPRTKTWNKALAFYEKNINGMNVGSEDYIRLADILYDNNMIEKAIPYYMAAYENGNQDEWAMYRIAAHSDGAKAEKIYSQLQKSNSVVGRMVRAKQKELDIQQRLAEVL